MLRFSSLVTAAVLVSSLSPAIEQCGPGDDDTPTPVPNNTEQVMAELAVAVDGLYYLSESDYPFTVVMVEGAATEPLTADNIKEAIAPIYVDRPEQATLEERSVEVWTLEQFFAPLTTPEDWWEDYQYEQLPQYEEMQRILTDEVLNASCFRLGEEDSFGTLFGSIDVYLVGSSTGGDLVGVWTISVET